MKANIFCNIFKEESGDSGDSGDRRKGEGEGERKGEHLSGGFGFPRLGIAP